MSRIDFNPLYGHESEPQIIFAEHGESKGPYLHYFNGNKLYAAKGSIALYPEDFLKPKVADAIVSLKEWGTIFKKAKIPYLSQPPSMAEDPAAIVQDWQKISNAGYD